MTHKQSHPTHCQMDRIVQDHFPTIVTPISGQLPELNTGKTRLVMSAYGCALESKPAWGHLCLPLWKSPRALQAYGKHDFFMKFPKEKTGLSLRDAMREDAVKHSPKEFASAIYFNTATNKHRYVEHNATQREIGKIDYERAVMLPNEVLMVDIHSHGNGMPYFSHKDNTDDAGGVKIAMVLGQCNQPETINIKLRLCIEGFFFNQKQYPQLLDVVMGKTQEVLIPCI